jgi:FAD:protein FMN transferase
MMSLGRRQCLQLALGLGSALPGGRAAARDASALQWRERALLGFGTTLWLRAAHTDEKRVQVGLDAAVQAIRHVERQMSLFDEYSALCQLNREGRLDAADPDLLRVLRLAQQVAAASQGAFDVTMQPLWRTWEAARQAGVLADGAALRAARRHVDWRALRVDARSIDLLRPGMAISLNGIAQGYAADLARSRLQAAGIAHALLDTGEWSAWGRGPQARPWRLSVAEPAAPRLRPLGLELVNDGRAVATSSDAHSVFSADRRHHHIIDPRSGYSPTSWSSVTVLARSCALADALTKVLFMATPTQAMAQARRWGVDVLLVDKTGRWHASAGLPLRRADPAPGRCV